MLAQVAAELSGAAVPRAPVGAAFVELVCTHYEEMLRFYGPELGGRVSRKHLGWYMDEAATPAALRREVLTERVPARVLQLLPSALSTGAMAA